MLPPFEQAVLFTSREKNIALDSVERVAHLSAKLAEDTYGFLKN